MGIKLMRDVLDSPAPLTPTQRLILVALAVRAGDDTGRVLPSPGGETPQEMLLRRTGLAAGALAGALAELEGKGWLTLVEPAQPSATRTPEEVQLYVSQTAEEQRDRLASILRGGPAAAATWLSETDRSSD